MRGESALPVRVDNTPAFIAQLDRAQASDAWCRGFESPWTHCRISGVKCRDPMTEMIGNGSAAKGCEDLPEYGGSYNEEKKRQR